MAELPIPKQEKYAKQRASGLIPSKAAIAAGYMPGSAVATNLERDPDIIARIEELHAARYEQRERIREATSKAAEVVGELTGISHAWVIQQLIALAADARSDGDFREAKDCMKLIGEHLGMWGKAPIDGETSSQMADSLAEKALERMDRLSDSLAHLDITPPVKDIPDERDLMGLIGTPYKKPVEVLTGTEIDVALHPRSDIDPAHLPDAE